jgi:hypothetical protein
VPGGPVRLEVAGLEVRGDLRRSVIVASVLVCCSLKAVLQTGKRSNPMCIPAQLGCCRDAPLRPHLVQRGRLSQQIARRVGPPSDDERDECYGLAVHTVLADHPAPRRATAQLLKRRPWRPWFHAARMTLVAPVEKPRGMLARVRSDQLDLGPGVRFRREQGLQLRSRLR